MPVPNPLHAAMVTMPEIVAMRVAGHVARIAGAVVAAAIVVKRTSAVEGATAVKRAAAERAEAAERTKKADARTEVCIRRRDRGCGAGDGNHGSKVISR